MIIKYPSYNSHMYIAQVGSVFINDPWDLDSIPDLVIQKTQKMVLENSLPNIKHYEVLIKSKIEQSREKVAPSATLPCSN